MKTLWSGMLVALLGVGTWTGPVLGQADEGRRWFEVNVHSGTMHLALTEDHQLMAGGRVGLTTGTGWGVGGNFDWVNTDFATVTMYSAEVNLTIDSGIPADLMLAVGAGAASVSPEDAGDTQQPVVTDDTDFMVPIGIGLKWHDPSAAAPYIGYRVDVRDNIIFAADDFDKDRHNWEFSAGVSILF